MTIADQISELDRSVDELAACLASLSEDLLLRKLNGWTPRDILAHLIGWNRYVVKGSLQLMKGELPFYDVDPGEDYAKVNAAILETYPSTNRAELLRELRESAAELGSFLASLNPASWDCDYGVRNQGSVITIKNTADDLIADYGHHCRQIESWCQGSTDGDPQP
ncbi:MAG: ClbS/DfsB family four-helix bundle protein [bacterium]|nr:ClbS/DfsB family four-helix bundle protein [bacterium]